MRRWRIDRMIRSQKSSRLVLDVYKRQVEESLEVATMICQRGYGPSETPRIRYAAIERALGLVDVYKRQGLALRDGPVSL